MNQPQVQLPPYSVPPQLVLKSQIKPVNQLFGTVVAVIFGLFTVRALVIRLDLIFAQMEFPLLGLNQLLHFISAALRLFFFVQMIRVPEFLAGNPTLKKFTVIFVILFVEYMRIAMIKFLIAFPPRIKYRPVPEILLETSFFLLSFVLYFHDDSKQGCFLCFKPWVYKDTEQFSYEPDKTATVPVQAYNYPTRSQPYTGYNQPIQPVQIQSAV